jgi:hypothetical protein
VRFKIEPQERFLSFEGSKEDTVEFNLIESSSLWQNEGVDGKYELQRSVLAELPTSLDSSTFKGKERKIKENGKL